MDPPSEPPPKQPRGGRMQTTGPTSGRKRVEFTSELPTPAESHTPTPTHTPPTPEDSQPESSKRLALQHELSHEEISEGLRGFQPYVNVPKPRPAIYRTERPPARFLLGDDEEEDSLKKGSGKAAVESAVKLSKSVGTYSASAPVSRSSSRDRFRDFDASVSNGLSLPPKVGRDALNAEVTDEEADEGPALDLKSANRLLKEYSRHPSTLQGENFYHEYESPFQSGEATPVNLLDSDDERVARPPRYRKGVLGILLKAARLPETPAPSTPPHPAGPATRPRLAGTSTAPERPGPPPRRRPTGHGRNPSSGSLAFSDASTLNDTLHSPTLESATPSGATTPSRGRTRPWYSRSANSSVTSFGYTGSGQNSKTQNKKHRPGLIRNLSSQSLATLTNLSSALKVPKPKRSGLMKDHLADILARQRFLRKICEALMKYGAPTHRLEDFMEQTAESLEINCQFLYMPGCMIMAFDDTDTRTSEVRLIRTPQGVELDKLLDVYQIYKAVSSGNMPLYDATKLLQEIIDRNPNFNRWWRVLLYGFASATVGPFAFEARLVDLPFCFALGCGLGCLQLIVVPRNELMGNMFEVTAAVLTSFLARALGSIHSKGHEVFCFSAMAQSSIALILPGYIVLCASLELQARHMVAGSVRMVYALIYSFILGFGIMLGSVIFGTMYKGATSATHCENPLSNNPGWNYLFVFLFSICLTIINQAKWKQMPTMVVIAMIGYAVSLNTAKYVKGNSQVSSTVGAFAIGVSSNLQARFWPVIEEYWQRFWSKDTGLARVCKRSITWLGDRCEDLVSCFLRSRHRHRKHVPPEDSTPEALPMTERHRYSHRHTDSSTSSVFSISPSGARKTGYGLAATAMIPAIFVQVPSGLSVSGSLVSGVISADQITRNATGSTIVSGGDAETPLVNNVALKVGFSVIQIAIGITVGLFLAALVMYPLGKKRRTRTPLAQL